MNWDSSYVSGGTQTFVQGNDASFTVGATYIVTVNGSVTVGNVTAQGAAGSLTLIQSSAANSLYFPAGNWTVDTGTRILTEGTGVGFAGSSGAVITKKGTGTLAGLQPAGYGGKWILKEGNVSLGSQGAFFGTNAADDTITLDGGQIRHTAGTRTISGTGITVGAGGGNIYCSAAITLDVTAKISGAGAFTVGAGGNGSSLVILDNANNSFTQLTVGGGTARAGLAGSIPPTCAVTMTSGNTLDLNNNAITITNFNGAGGTLAIGTGSLTLNGTAADTYGGVFTSGATGKMIKNGSGTNTFTGNSTTFAGEFVVNNGTIGYGSSGALGANATAGTITINGGKLSNNGSGGRSVAATVAVNLNGDFTVDDSLFNSSTPGQIAFNGPSTIKNGNRTITVNGLANLGLAGAVGQDVAGRSIIKSGNGTLALTGANTYSGDTTILGGVVNINTTSTLGNGAGTLHLSGGRLNSTGSRTASSAPVGNPLDITTDSAISTSSTAANVDLNLSNNIVSAAASSTLTFTNAAISAAGIFQPRFSGEFVYGGMINIANGANGTTVLQSYNTTGTTETFTNVISGTGGYIRNASTAGSGGTTVFGAANTYSGGTTVSRGTLIVTNSSGSGTGTGAVTVAVNGVLGGNGSISGNVDLTGVISPGNSPGKLTTGAQNWNGGAHYGWQINQANGGAGLDPGWDTLAINGGLNIAATPGSKFNLDLSTLNLANAPGNMDSFTNTLSYAWTIVSTTDGITNFDATAFNINRSAVSNDLGSGILTVALANAGKDLQLVFAADNPPVLTVPPNQTVAPLSTLTVTNTATDPDVPTVLTFSLVSVVPTPSTVVSLNATNGVLTWTPAVADGPNDYTITVRVTDDAPTPQSDTKSFAVHVNGTGVSTPQITTVSWASGTTTVTWTNAVAARSYRLYYSDDISSPLTNAVAGDVVAGGTTASKADTTATGAQRFYRVVLLP
jgi:fibronectin-binding autotransporter adhesin